MLEYTVNLNSVSKLIKLQRIVKHYQLHGNVRQNYFKTGLRSSLLMLVALPLNELEVTISDCPTTIAPEVLQELQSLAA